MPLLKNREVDSASAHAPVDHGIRYLRKKIRDKNHGYTFSFRKTERKWWSTWKVYMLGEHDRNHGCEVQRTGS